MTNFKFLIVIVIALTFSTCKKSATDLYRNKADLYGKYFGETFPGNTPQRFCQQFFSDEIHTPPIFSPDGKEVYWRLMNEEDTKIIMMKMEGNKWSKPSVASFNLRNNNDAPFITSNGERLYFLSAQGSTSNNYDENIYYVNRLGANWSNPIALPDCINDFNIHWEISVSANYNIYFQDLDKHDIYYSMYTDGIYQTPIKLPETINSPTMLEGTPFIAPDESYLIFDRRTGGDDANLYISFKDNNGSWTEAINMGSQINTSGHEFYAYVTPDNYLFFLRMTNDGTYPYWVDAQILYNLKPMK